MMRQGMVVAAQPEAAEAGAAVLARGGNAVDAAIATALVQTSVDPQMCGIAGFGCMHIHDTKAARSEIIDFYSRAPLAATADMWLDRLERETDDGFGFILSDRANEIGYNAVATPATLRGLELALTKYGTLPMADLIEPAISYARNGVMVRPHMAAFWAQLPTEGGYIHTGLLDHFEATRRIYIKPDGRLYGVGETLRNPDYATTLERIAAKGVDDFFNGGLADMIAKDFKANGGLLGEHDLRSAKAQSRDPLVGSYRGLDIITNPPPGGGIQLIEMLHILESFDLGALGHNSADYIGVVAEVMKIGARERDQYNGDPAFIDVPEDMLTSKAHAASWADRIRAGEKIHVPRFGAKEAADTTHCCVIDRDGMCVSLTHTLGMPSGVVTPGLGFMYNGVMMAFDPRPGRAGSIAPGKARMSSIAPTIVLKDGKPLLVIGAPGGSYITPGILQVILNVVDFSMTALEAVSAARFCATGDTIWLTNRILRSTERELSSRGYPVKRSPYNFYFAGVHAIRVDGEQIDGGADPGRDGMSIAVP